MKLLVGKTFGIGNAVMAVPMLKALRSLGPDSLDVLVGSTPDDFGAWDVMHQLQRAGVIDALYVDSTPGFDGEIERRRKYDYAVMAIPFDGRWRKGHSHDDRHFSAHAVIDGRPRPDPSTVGLSSWKKHEVEYQMENARTLGYEGETPTMDFLFGARPMRPRHFYLGVGYKKDAAGFWKKKHWGNENFAAVAGMILAAHPENRVVMTGDMADGKLSIAPILDLVEQKHGGTRGRISWNSTPRLRDSFHVVSSCSAYVGNDTGMMHVAAAHGLPCSAVFRLENSITKNGPWGDGHHAFDGSQRDITPEEVFESLEAR